MFERIERCRLFKCFVNLPAGIEVISLRNIILYLLKTARVLYHNDLIP